MNNASTELTTADGVTIAADLALPDGEINGVVVVCHPHPLYGGDRHNPVVDAIYRTLPINGIATIRFDFRGAGGSSGRHGEGTAERLDVDVAVDLASSYAVPIVLVGYSFGGVVALTVDDLRIAAWVGVAAPLAASNATVHPVGADVRHKLLLVPQHDQFAAPDVVRERTAEWCNTSVLDVPMADHFLNGRTAWVAGQVAAFADLVVGGRLND